RAALPRGDDEGSGHDLSGVPGAGRDRSVNRASLESLLADVAAGKQTPEEALERLRRFPSEDLGFAVLDHHRSLRQGHPEVVFCEGKSVAQVLAICERLQAAHGGFLGTRATE